MEAISKEAILSKTQYGIGIYAHILRLHYPDETVLSLSGRTCSPAKNPFNADKSILNIFIYKENILGNAMDKEFARHTDSENTIPAGDAFDFAELHYKQSGDDLLQILNKEMNLRIGENWSFYKQSKTSNKKPNKESVGLKNEKAFAFSFYKAPIRNVFPHKTVSLTQVYNAIKGDYYRHQTEELRSILDSAKARKYKAANFDYCTFSGVFNSRSDKSLVKHSELLCIDFDHVQDLDKLRQALLADEYFDTQLLFVSPSGDGLKWIIEIDTQESPHGEYFTSLANYILQTYSVEVDKSGKDISRACFIPYDPDVFINPLLKKYEQEEI
ncbi:MAG: BT4734/BF3469 family protein [Tenuifilaceae bacterium]|nr:BT4734/BF3469 family protein [Tenuifilaceae bacterium]